MSPPYSDVREYVSERVITEYLYLLEREKSHCLPTTNEDFHASFILEDPIYCCYVVA